MRITLMAIFAAVAASCAAARPPPGVIYVSPWDRCVAGCAPFRCLAASEIEDEGDRLLQCACTSHELLTLKPRDAAK